MASENMRNSVSNRVNVHDQQDRALADKLGKINPNAGIDKLQLPRVNTPPIKEKK